MGEPSHGPIDNWLRTLVDTQQYFWAELQALAFHPTVEALGHGAP
jgi:hypothetical protein